MIRRHPRIENGWLAGASRVPSPNCDERPADAVISLLVLHCISLPDGCYGGGAVEALFTNCLCAEDHPSFVEIAPLKVSAHLFIRRDGSPCRTERARPGGRSGGDGGTLGRGYRVGGGVAIALGGAAA